MRDPDTLHDAFRFFLTVAVFLLIGTISGCGLLGSGDESEDDSLPDPPGRPNSSVQLVESHPVSFASVPTEGTTSVPSPTP